MTTDEDALSAFPAIPDVDAPDLFAELNAAFHSPVVVTIPPGTSSSSSRSSSTTTSVPAPRSRG